MKLTPILPRDVAGFGGEPTREHVIVGAQSGCLFMPMLAGLKRGVVGVLLDHDSLTEQ